MKKQKTKLVLTTFLVLCLLTGGGLFVHRQTVHADSPPLSGSGTPSDPYQIASCSDLQTMEDDLTANYVLTNNIDCSATSSWNGGAGFIPIGTNGNGNYNAFSGNFNGQSFTIDHLTIDSSVNGPDIYTGLFGFSTGVISNVFLTNVSVMGTNAASSGFIPPSTGAVIGFDEGSIVQKVSVSGTVSSGCANNIQLGGLIGYDVGGTISQSSFSGNVTLSSTCNFELVGGFIGNSYTSNVNNSYSTGAVTVNGQGSGTDNVGGFIGQSGGPGISVTNNYSTSSVTVQGASLLVPSYQAGSFIGALENSNSSTVTNDFTTGAVSTPATCSNTDCGTNPRVANAFIGNDSIGNDFIDLSTDYYDQTAVGLTQCDSIGSTCNAVNTDGSQPAYFMDSQDVLNPPLDQWDFDTAWQANTGLPLLRILPSPYPDPPTGVVATPVSDTALDVTWNDPNYTGTSDIQSFIVQYKVNGTTDWQSGFVDGDNDELVLTGLTPGTQYAVEVFVVNTGNNISQPSSTVLATMGLTGYTAISSCQQLQDINNNLSGNYYLANNIDCSATSGWNGGMGFIPIGDVGGDTSTPFSGTLEGNDYTITNLTSGNLPLADLGGETAGVFVYSTDGATLRDLRFNTPNLSGNQATLILFLEDSTVSNVQVENVNISGGIEGSNNAGLAVVDDDSTIDQTSVTGHLVSSGGLMGGLVASVGSLGGGSTFPTITNSYADVTLTGGDENDLIGGLVGLDGSADLVINDSYATGIIIEGGTNSSVSIGGLIGANGVASQTNNSFSNMRIENTDTGAQVGGLIGTAGGSATTNDYYNADLAGTTQCSGDMTANCTAVNTSSSNPSYFYANKTNSPLQGWDFTNVWEITSLTPTFLTNSSTAPPTVASGIKPVLIKPPTTTTTHPATQSSTTTTITKTKQTTYATKYSLSAAQAKAATSSTSASITAAIQHFIQHVPKAVLVSFPYALFSLLILGAIAVVIEIVRQSRRLSEDQLLLAEQKRIAEERDTFWHLAANYLRAPITLLSGGAELLTLSKTAEPVAADIDHLAKNLQSKVAEIMQKIESSRSLRDIALPSVTASRSVLRQMAFWVPVVIVAVLAALSDYVAKDFRHLSTSFINYVTQAVLLVIVAFILHWVLNGLGHISQKRKQTALLVSEQAKELAQARRLLIGATADELDADLRSLERLLSALPKEEQAQETLREGALRLRHIVDSFQLLMSAQSDSLETISPPTTTSSLQKTVTNVLDSLKPLIDSKKVHFSLPQFNNIVVPGSDKLLDQIISSTISNAVQFSPTGGAIAVALKHEHGATTLSISDQGQGMSEEQQTHLFKPFTRADYKESLQLNHDGIGINLYIDKLLMEYLGGSITATSKVGSGTTIKISWPANREIQAGMLVLPEHAGAAARARAFGAS